MTFWHSTAHPPPTKCQCHSALPRWDWHATAPAPTVAAEPQRTYTLKRRGRAGDLPTSDFSSDDFNNSDPVLAETRNPRPKHTGPQRTHPLDHPPDEWATAYAAPVEVHLSAPAHRGLDPTAPPPAVDVHTPAGTCIPQRTHPP